MTARKNRLLLASPLLALLAACASPATAVRPSDEAPKAAVAAPAPSEAAASPRAQRLFDEAVTALDEQRKLKIPTDWVLLERKWRAAAAEGVPEAWFNVGVALEGQEKPAEARKAYEAALSVRPAMREAAVNLAFLDEAGAEPRDAARAYAELLSRHPEDGLVRVRLAEIYRQAGQPDEAWRLAREALRRDPSAVAAYPVMMRVALERGSLDLAELIGVRARKLGAPDAEVSYLLGQAAERRRDEPQALSLYRKAAAQDPGYLAPRYRLLELGLAARSWDGAADQARAILKGNPSDARVHLALGVALRNGGKPEEALAEYERALSFSGGRLSDAYLARGIAFAKGLNRCEPALAELDRYEQAVGPTAAVGSPAPALRRECVQLLASAKEAQEAARQMQAEAERAAAAKAKPPAAPAKEGAAPAENR